MGGAPPLDLCTSQLHGLTMTTEVRDADRAVGRRSRKYVGKFVFLDMC